MKLNFDDLNTDDRAPTPAWAMDEDLISRLKLGFFGLAIAATFGVGISQAFSPQARSIRSELRQQDSEQSRQLTIQQQQQRHGAQSRQIAEQNYQDGCLLVRLLDDMGQPISLYTGLVVVDSSTQQPLAQGTVVCDPNGATSVLDAGGVVGVVAITPDLELVNQAIQDGRVR
jgi:hypothetical protein